MGEHNLKTLICNQPRAAHLVTAIVSINCLYQWQQCSENFIKGCWMATTLAMHCPYFHHLWYNVAIDTSTLLALTRLWQITSFRTSFFPGQARK